jgi:signal transduction histidine kinase/ABC-type nitrate/sulfonate/bicarbonate transport system substrate-binding protein
MTKLKPIFILFFIFFYILNIDADEPKKLDKISIQLHWKYQFEFAGFIAAKEKGFYKELGLDVELKEYQFGIDIEKDVLNGVSDYGIYNSYTLIDYLNGEDIVLVSSFFKRAALVLVASKDIKSPKDLVGKKIMATTKEDFILNFKPYFNTYGVEIDDVELVPHSYKIDDFKNKKISAMTAFISDQLYKLDNEGIKYNVLDPSDDNIFTLQMEMFTSKKEMQEHPEHLEAIKKASAKGWRYALSHKEELADIIYNKYMKNDTRGIDKNMLLSEAEGIQKLILPYTYIIGSIDENFLQKQMKLFKEQYHIGDGRRLDEFVYHKTTKNNLNYNEKEIEYLSKNKYINVCLQYDKFPFDSYVDGKFIGIMSDVFKEISNQTSVEFIPIISKNEQELRQHIEDKKCKLLSFYIGKSTVYKDMVSTKPFSSTHFTLISKLDKSFIHDPKNLKGKKLLVELVSMKKYLNKMYPYLDIDVIHNKNKIIKNILKDKADAFITFDEEADYIIDKYGYGKLKINGFLSSKDSVEISIGVQKEETVLKSILDKSIEKISKEKIQNIFNSWRLTRYQKSVDYTVAYYILGVMFIIFSIMIYYHRKLKKFNIELEKQVYNKTKELRDINESLEEKVKSKVQKLIEKDEILTSQSKQAVMGEMISMIAHQWRQPLNMITLQISNLQIKHMMKQEISAELLDKTLNEITDTIVYLADTVEDFKEYFHPDKEKTKIELDEVIKKALNFVSPRLKSHKVDIDTDDIDKITIETYPNDLIQIVLNILNNSIDAYDNQKDTDKKYIKIYTKQNDSYICIYIKDEAGGIEKQLINKLFEPYFSTKGKNGTGLGLYMSKMIIEKQFNGEIDVESYGITTIFKLKIPITS